MQTRHQRIIVGVLLIAGIGALALFVVEKNGGAFDVEQRDVWMIQVLPFVVMGIILLYMLFQKRES